MQNNNETNEKVSKVVADFFKSKPLAKHNNNNHKRRPYPNRADAHKKQADGQTEQSAQPGENECNDSVSAPAENESKNEHSVNKKRYSKNYNKHDRRRDRQNNTEEAKEMSEESVNDTQTEVNAPSSERTEPVREKKEAPIAPQNNDESEWYDPNTPVEIIGVRFKAGGKIYYFAPMGFKVSKGDNVIVETARGLEFGTVQTPNSVIKIKDVVMPLKNVVRIATPEDIKHHEDNNAKIREAMRVCNERIAVHNLEMKLVEVEYTFDNSKLLFYFTSEGRVDFRELVKDLAGIFKTRIELRQIGIREETKLLGGIGICGLPFCCKTFLNDFAQVSIKMAKEQGLSLNSAKISGACGRLMCCLRYEYETYDEEIRKTPKVDTPVITPDGPGVICETQPLAGLCKVKLTNDDETVIKVYHRDDLKPAASNDKKNHPKHEKTEKQNDSEPAPVE